MTRHLSFDLPDEIDRALQDEAARTGKSPEEVAIECIETHFKSPPRGTVDALMPSHGTWSMTPDERLQIEKMIEDERLLEKDAG